VMVHIDPEDDMETKSNVHLPSRPGLLEQLAVRFDDLNLADYRVVFHYLDGKVDAELYLPADKHSHEQAAALQARCDELDKSDPVFRAIHIHSQHAQK